MSIAKSSFLFATGTVISRFVGLLREAVIASVFGAGMLLDAFLIANRIPNLLREMLAEGALGASFTKTFAAKWEKDPAEAKKLLINSLWVFGLFVSILSMLGIIAAPYIVKTLTFFAENRKDGPEFIRQTTGLTRLLFPFITLMSIGAIASGALHQKGRFFLSAVSPIALNLGYIFGALVLSKGLITYAPNSLDSWLADRKIVGLAIGVLLGGALQLGMQLYGIWKPYLKGESLGIKNISFNQDLKEIILLMTPMVIAASASQINILVNSNFATSLQSGAVTWLNGAFRLLHLPVGIFAIAISSASLPALTRSITRAKGKIDKTTSEQLQSTVELMLWLVTPSFIMLSYNSLELVQFIFQRGLFDATASIKTAEALFAYSFGLFGLAFIKVITSLYYAMNKTSYAMKVSLFSIFLNFAINYYLVGLYGHQGLAFTASAVVTFNALFLMLGLIPLKLSIDFKRMSRTLLFLLTAALLSWGGQSLISPLIKSLEFMQTSSINLQAFTLILCNGTLITSVFLASSLFFFKTSPRQLVAKLRNR